MTSASDTHLKKAKMQEYTIEKKKKYTLLLLKCSSTKID